MGIEEYVDDDLLFILKYGLIISNFLTIAILLFLRKNRQEVIETKSVLLLTAHPDDEAMFFLPTIQYLKEQNYIIHLLCLSTGNANKLGKIRQSELQKCSTFLGIEKLTIIDDPDLQDSMQIKWPIDKIKQILQNYIQQHNIAGIITFDSEGISGHTNHIACHLAAKELKDIKIFMLQTTNILRKYSSILDFFFSSITSDHVMIQTNPFLAWKAMKIHHSQFVWYRKLFVIFSRYAYINTLIKI